MRENLIQESKNPKMGNNKVYFRFWGTAITFILLTVFMISCTKEIAKDQSLDSPSKVAAISETFPANLADAVVVNPVVAVTFKNVTDPKSVSSSTLTLKNGTVSVSGTVSYSGTTATFTPSEDLTPDTEYTATFKSSDKNSSSDSSEHSWTFKTGRNHGDNQTLVTSVVPLKSAESVSVTIQPKVTFSDKVNSTTIKSTTFTLKQGNTLVEGKITFSDHSATFIPVASLSANTVYTGTITSGVSQTGDDESDDESDDEHSNKSSDEHSNSSATAINYSWSFTTANSGIDISAPEVNSSAPANNSTAVAVNIKPTVIFNEAMNPLSISAATFTLTKGTTAVAGTVTYSGNSAIFTPASSLAANSVYTGTITSGAKDVAGNSIAGNYTWSFTTGGSVADVTAPTILSVVPVNNATLIALNSKATVTFSEAMNSATITTATFTLKQGSTIVPGNVAYSGTTATFTPASDLTSGLVYTATITTGAKDVAGNALASNYTWSFTTANAVVTDVTPPTVLSVIPASGAASIAVNSNITAAFSESMNSSTITTTTFTLKQGSTTVAGSVSYSGTNATFNPTSDLTGGLVYTATITTGAKDVAGNAITVSKVWSFTTVAPVVAGLSFAVDIVPVLNACNSCHKHGWTASTVASTYYASLLSSGYINTTTYTSGKLNRYATVSHAGSNQSATEITKLLDWMKAGSPNN